jgi:hypothetical protein
MPQAFTVSTAASSYLQKRSHLQGPLRFFHKTSGQPVDKPVKTAQQPVSIIASNKLPIL